MPHSSFRQDLSSNTITVREGLNLEGKKEAILHLTTASILAALVLDKKKQEKVGQSCTPSYLRSKAMGKMDHSVVLQLSLKPLRNQVGR